MTQPVTAQGSGPAAILQQGAFSHDGAGAALADLGAVHRHAEHPVEQQVNVGAGHVLFGEQLAFG